MSYYCEILTFRAKTDKKKIQTECDMWANEHCDPEERGGRHGGLVGDVKFTSLVFDSYEDAVEYLKKTFGNYRQTAVQYRKYPEVTSAKLKTLQKQVEEQRKKLHIMESIPHYKGVKQATVKCKSCSSSLATAFCGINYYNSCPVCKAELRPETALNRIQACREKLNEMQMKLRTEKKALQKKMESKAELFWAVACEVHC